MRRKEPKWIEYLVLGVPVRALADDVTAVILQIDSETFDLEELNGGLTEH